MNKSLYVHYWIQFRCWEIILNPVSKIWIFTGLGSAVVVELEQSEHLKFIRPTGTLICRCLWQHLPPWDSTLNSKCCFTCAGTETPAISASNHLCRNGQDSAACSQRGVGLSASKHRNKLLGRRVQGGRVDPCRGSAMFPPSSSIASCRGHLFVVCLLAAEPTERQVGLL